MLFLQAGQTGEVWGTFQKATLFQNRGKVLSLFFVFENFILFEMLSDTVFV